MARIACIVIYPAAAVAAVVLLNANNGHEELAVAIWVVASVLLGWGAGRLSFALLAFWRFHSQFLRLSGSLPVQRADADLVDCGLLRLRLRRLDLLHRCHKEHRRAPPSPPGLLIAESAPRSANSGWRSAVDSEESPG